MLNINFLAALRKWGKNSTRVIAGVLLTLALLSGCASVGPSGALSLYDRRYEQDGGRKSRATGSRPSATISSPQKGRSGLEGVASWYGPGFHGKRTANGEIYNMYSMTAAHKTLPFDTIVRVNNLDNGRSIVVRINDRGPFVNGRIIDLSRSAAEKLGMVGPGTANVKLEVLSEGGG